LPQKAANCFLIPRMSGRLAALPRLGEIRELRSFNHMRIGATLGQRLPRVAGIVTLIHPDRAVISEDRETVRELQSSGFYEIENSDP
jgi:hypothetical protein